MSKREPQDNGPVPQIVVGPILRANCPACRGQRLTIRKVRTPCPACNSKGEVYTNVEIVSVSADGSARRITVPRLVVCVVCQGAGGSWRSAFTTCSHCIEPAPKPLPVSLLEQLGRRESAATQSTDALPRGFEHEIVQVGPRSLFGWQDAYAGVVIRNGQALDGAPEGAWVELEQPTRPRMLLAGDAAAPWWRWRVTSSKRWLR